MAGFLIATMMPALVLAGVVLAAGGDSQTLGYAAFAGFISYPFALLVGLPGFDGDPADPAWLNLLANLAFLLPFVLDCAVVSSVVFWLIARPDLQRA